MRGTSEDTKRTDSRLGTIDDSKKNGRGWKGGENDLTVIVSVNRFSDHSNWKKTDEDERR